MPSNNISLVPIFCSVLESKGQAPSSEDQGLLEAYTTVRSWLTEINFGLGRFVGAKDAPGYLRTEINGRSYYVPYILVSVFPTTDQLNDIDMIVDLVRLSSTSAFCLSGSATFLGRVGSVTDLDFCEYYIEDTTSLKKCIPQKMGEIQGCNLVRVKLDGKVWLLPFLGLDSLLREADGAPVMPPPEPAKFDFLISTDYFGAIVVTNLVLPTDPGFLPGTNLAKSFQFQEAVIFDSESVPKRSLLNPREIGAYMNWLRSEAIKYRDEAASTNNWLAIKALKRAMSWFLMAGLDDQVDRIIIHLQDPDMDNITSIARRREVDRFLEILPKEPLNK